MKRVLICIFFVFACATAAFAKNKVDNVAISVQIHNNGMATVTEEWEGNFDDGSKISFDVGENLYVKEFQVWQNDVKYKTEGTKKSGNATNVAFYVKESDINRIIISYLLDPLLKSYNNIDGFKYNFVKNRGFDNTNLYFRLYFDNGFEPYENNSFIKVKGFEGNAHHKDGEVIAYSLKPLKNSDTLDVTFAVYKGATLPNVIVYEDFDTSVFTPGDYRVLANSSVPRIPVVPVAAIVVILIILFLYKFLNKKNKKNK